MPIVTFQNRLTSPLRLVVAPRDRIAEVPHLAEVGIRYTLDEGAEDRSTAVVSNQEIEFWCNAAKVEIDVVLPLPAEKLLWDICVNLGFCGGLVNGVPTHVTDLLPAEGSIGAGAFADLVIQAEGDGPYPDEARSRWSGVLKAKFVEHLGAAAVPVKTLKRMSRRPFDPPAAD